MPRHPHPLAAALSAAALLTLPCASTATPTAGSPYYTDVANEYVQDATSDGMSNLNMVLCIMNAMSPADMLTNKGVLDSTSGITEVKYIALIDKNRCDSRARADVSNSASGSTGATSTPNYMTAIVDVTRGSNASDPMVGKIWMSLTEQGHTTAVTVKLTATTDPATLPPYGQLRLDYVGYSNSTLQFNGFIDANGGVVNHVESGTNSSNVALALNATSTTAGNGVIQSTQNNGSGPVTLNYKFAYNSAAFARKETSGTDICFDRTKANAHRSVWRYGVYDASTGLRVDQAHPGFPLTATTGNGLSGVPANQKVFGYAGYWGVNFGGMDPNLIPALPDGQITAVSGITDGRPNNTTTYNLFKNSGKLIQWSQHATTLGAISGVPFSFFGEGCVLANGGAGGGSIASPRGASCATAGTGPSAFPMSPDYRNWVMQWDAASSHFQVVGMQDCTSGNCLISTFANPTTVLQGFKQMPINAWSDALGNLTIPIPPGDTMQSGGSAVHANSDPVYYYSQSTVLPASGTPSALFCLSNCPTAASLAAASNNPANSPFASPSNMQWGAGTAQFAYTFSAAGLQDGANATVMAGTINNPMWQGGVNSGRLFTTTLAASNGSCPSGVAFCEPSNPSVYYTYQTGGNQWNQTMWLTNAATNAPVPFDPPQSMAFTVPSDAATYGSWAGKAIQLQFNGFGNLNGIPGTCVDPADNTAVNCTPATRFVPAFALPDGASLSLGSQQVLTRALDSELRLAKEVCPNGLSTAGVSVSLPTSQPHNPTLASDTAYFIGTAPSLTGAPAVIDGVLQ